MPYLTLTKNLKLQLSPGIVASYNISQETGWVYSGTNTHTFTYLLTCPGPTRGIKTKYLLKSVGLALW